MTLYSEVLPDDEVIDDFVFEVQNPKTGERMAIYSDGQIVGFPTGFTAVSNKIPELVRRAADIGYTEALTRVIEARRDAFMRMVGEFRSARKS